MIFGSFLAGLNPYTAQIKAAAIITAFVLTFAAGWKVSSWRHSAAQVSAVQDTVKKSVSLQDVANKTEVDTTGLLRSVYDYYSKHPHVVYRDRIVDGLPVPSGCQTGTTGTPAVDHTDTTDNGHATTGSTEEVQVIEPDLLPRCAATTVQALECREYVINLKKEFDKE